jgi:hypothetical protein
MKNLKQRIKIAWWKLKLLFKRPVGDDNFIYDDDRQD